MMQVAGGMDRLPAALAARLGNRIVYRAAVREIRQGERGVCVIYADADGRLRRVDADYCVCTIPLPVLSEIQKDFSQPVQSTIAAARYNGAGKIGLQFKRRFWDEDDDIYGGRSLTVRRLDRSSIHHTDSRDVKAYSWATIWTSSEPCASAPLPNVNGLRSSKVPPYTPSTPPSSRRRSRSRGLVASRAVEPRLMEVGNGRGAPATRWSGSLRRRLHDEHELVDERSVRLSPRGRNGDPPSRRRSTLITTPLGCEDG